MSGQREEYKLWVVFASLGMPVAASVISEADAWSKATNDSCRDYFGKKSCGYYIEALTLTTTAPE